MPKIKTRIFASPKLALCLVVTIALLALALLAWPAPRALAQSGGPGKVDGQIFNGTHDALAPNTGGLTVTLYVADMGTQTTITQTAQSDSQGHFAFSNIGVLTTTRMLAVANYLGIDYVSDILSFDGIANTVPVSVTVYEMTTDPSTVKIAQMHTIIAGVQDSTLNVLQIVQLQNSGDRTYVGDTSIGPHRITLSLPILDGATDIQFDSQDADSTTIRGTNILSYTLPFQPGNDQIVYNYTIPFNPPTYALSLKLPFDVLQYQLLLADVGATVTSTQLSAPTTFPTQSGQNYLMSTASNLTKGTVIKATFNNLPATASSPNPTTTGSNPPSSSPAPVDSNSQAIGLGVLGLAAVAAILLIAYPLIRRRANRAAVASTNRRMELLQEIADLDDDFEAGKVTESTYKEERARLKTKLTELGEGE
jgi:hypothetical protein